MAYAYQDENGVLRVVGSEISAKHQARGGIVATYIPCSSGYPQVPDGNRMTPIIVYEDGSAYIGGDSKNGQKVSLCNYPTVKAVFNSLK